MANVYTNKHGRRPTRGLRPWLLLPKLVSVTVFLGSLAAASFVWFTSRWTGLDSGDPRRLWVVNLIGDMMRFLVVPALLLAMVLGVGLLLQHPRTFLRLRWLRFKLACLLAAIPASHFFLSSRLALLRSAAEAARDDAAGAAVQFSYGLALSWIAFAGIVVIARLKPRLGQNWSRAFPGSPASSPLRSHQNVADDVPADVG